MIDHFGSNPVGILPAQSLRKEQNLSEMLRTIAETVGAYGCILWQVERRSSLPDSSADLKLFALSEWFPDDQIAELNDLPLDTSVTGLVTRTQQPINIEDIWIDGRTYQNDPFLSKAEIKVMCSVPVKYHDGAKGALNLYRNKALPFSSEEMVQIERMAPLVATLYQATRDKVSIDLVTGINELIETARLYNPETPLTQERIKKLIEEICELVSSSFHCFETSIFLEDYYLTPEKYELMATTWQKLFPQTITQKGIGLTGWVLERAKAVKIFDLIRFEKDQLFYQLEYPGITWGDDLNIRDTVYVELKAEYGNYPPPISYMAVPIMHGESVCGVMRCSFAQKIPHHFADRELQLLKLIAAQIGQCWNHWLIERDRNAEKYSWEKFVKRRVELNDVVNKLLERSDLDIKPVFDKALQIVADVITGAEILDIRLLAKETSPNYFYFESTYGKAWNEGGENERQRRFKKLFYLGNNTPQSAGEQVYFSGKTYVIPNVHEEQVVYQELFPMVKRMIVAPIIRKNEIIGLLDIRSTGDGVFPEYAVPMAEMLGQLIGIYYDLVLEIRDLKLTVNQATQKSQILETQRIEIAKILAHQFNTPITQAHARMNLLVRKFQGEDPLLKQLWPIRGLSGKAKRVSQNIRLFAQLAEGKTGGEISLKAEWMKADVLKKLLIEISRDTQSLVAPRRNIRFHVDESSFEKSSHDRHRIRELWVDSSLLEQAVFNLLDNAAKYSSPDSEARVYIGWTGIGRFHISVQNKGIKLDNRDIPKTSVQGWQSEEAKAVDGSGAGIGLWLVHNIMLAHDGELVPVPTSPEQITEFKLVFPEKHVR